MITDDLLRASLGTTDRLALRLRGGGVRRYHTHPGVSPQSVAEHSWRAAVIAHYLWPDRSHLLRAVILHDVAEALIGDLPAPTKRMDAGAALTDLETEYEKYIGISRFMSLDSEDQTRLKIVDYAELCLHVKSCRTEDEILCYNNAKKYVVDLLQKLPWEEERIRKILDI
jgi:5'-deoxynucleotidase YfbR-like HD superfamily hydrolase